MFPEGMFLFIDTVQLIIEGMIELEGLHLAAPTGRMALGAEYQQPRTSQRETTRERHTPPRSSLVKTN